jgi:putative ABC transport system permease protein
MKLTETFQLALKNILSSKVRALLTMLGIIIGVGAVIIIVGLGNGLKNYMTESFESMGTNLLTVNLMGRGNSSSRTVSIDDMYQLVYDNPEYLAAVSPTVSVSGTVKVGTETLSSTTVSGVGEDYDDMNRNGIASGRFIQFIDIDKYKKVCVVGSYISNEYFSGNAVGETLKINGTKYTIVGVLDEVASSEEGDSDDVVYLPYSVAQKISYTGRVSSYTFEVASDDVVSDAKTLIEDTLYSVYGSENYYRVTSMSEILDTMTSMVNIVVLVLSAIAAISLVVGGIGIMNIMLVSVSERTKEIGIRKSLGAKQRNILTQFVIEAATTSAMGGLLGIAFGFIVSEVATRVIASMTEYDITVAPSIDSVLLAFGISASIGVLFGYLPAKKAAKLNPIDALRYE